MGPDPQAKDGKASRLSILRECAQITDDGRSYFLDRMKRRTNGTSTPKVYCIDRDNPCQLDCYCAEDLCNSWTNDKIEKVAKAGQQRLGSADMEVQLQYDCTPSFSATSNHKESGTSSIAITICSFQTAVLGVSAVCHSFELDDFACKKAPFETSVIFCNTEEAGT